MRNEIILLGIIITAAGILVALVNAQVIDIPRYTQWYGGATGEEPLPKEPEKPSDPGWGYPAVGVPEGGYTYYYFPYAIIGAIIVLIGIVTCAIGYVIPHPTRAKEMGKKYN